MAKNAKCATALPDFHFLAKICNFKEINVEMVRLVRGSELWYIRVWLVLLGNESFGILKLGDFWNARIVLGDFWNSEFWSWVRCCLVLLGNGSVVILR